MHKKPSMFNIEGFLPISLACAKSDGWKLSSACRWKSSQDNC